MIYGHLIDVLVLVALPAALLLLSGREAESLAVGGGRDAATADSAAAASAMAAAAVGGLFAATRADSAASTPPAAADIVSHAFVQTGSELHYFRDVAHQDVLLSSITELADRQNRKMDAKKTPKSMSIFKSDSTYFGTLSVGVPMAKQVVVINPTTARFSFTAITSPAVGIQCSFFADKVLDPQQQTNFTIFVLPSHEVPINDHIIVHTSIGKFSHKVIADVARNPYRLRPLLGVKLPLNATHISPLVLHNPHAALMTITQVFSSDANVQVELSENALLRSGSAIKWELAPLETREVAKLHILGNLERNATSLVYVRFRLRHGALLDPSWATNEQDDSSDEKALIVPVEVQVTTRRNIFPTEHLLDFGLIRYGEWSRQLTLHVYTNIESGVDIDSIKGAGGGERDLYIHYAARPSVSVKCGARGQPGAAEELVRLTLSSAHGATDAHINDKLFRKRGTVVAVSRGGNYNVTVPYEALVYKGELSYDTRQLAFHCQEPLPAAQNVVLTNNFSLPLAIWNVSLSDAANDIFTAQLTTPIVILQPGQSLPALLVRYVGVQTKNISAELTLHTNLTDVRLPLFAFRGQLNVRLQSPLASIADVSRQVIDFGELAASEHRSVLLRLDNPNPVSVRVVIARRPWPAFTSVYLHDGSDQFIYQLVTDTFELPANSGRTLNVSLFASPQSALFDAHNPLFHNAERDDRLVLRTRFEELAFRATFRASANNVLVGANSITFTGGFVGTVASKPIKLYSTYGEDLPVSGIYLLGDDPRISISRMPNDSAIIKANSVSTLAHVSFAPGASCTINHNSNECYAGILFNSDKWQWFNISLQLPSNLAEIDYYLYLELRNRWEALTSKLVNATVVIDTPRVKNFEIPIRAELRWPRLLSHSVVRFPLTAVGNFTIVNLTLSNPSQQPIAVQLLPLVIYPGAESMLRLFQGKFPTPLIEPVEMNETLMFSLRDTELFTLRRGSPVPKLREELEKVFNITIPRFTLSMLLRPGMRVRIRIGFLPSDYVLRSSLLLIRNNLTGIEPVVLYGQGAHIRMEIDNQTAATRRFGGGSSTAPLLFAIQPAHLADCRNPRRLLHQLSSTLTVKRSFTVRNTGEVPFWVINISINNHPCENRGFRVLNCVSFTLAPNESTVLDVAYTPDFLMTQNDASLQLYMHMNGTPWIFDMCAQIPRHMLATCHAALPRPAFEGIMYYSCVIALLFCLICVVACSYLEGDRAVICAIRQLFIGNGERRVFDLNSVTPNRCDTDDAGDSAPLRSWFDWMTWRRLIPKPQRNRVYLRASTDSSRLTRLSRRVANYVLSFFAHFWVFLRGDGRGEICAVGSGSLTRPTDDGVKNEKALDVSSSNSAVSSDTRQAKADDPSKHCQKNGVEVMEERTAESEQIFDASTKGQESMQKNAAVQVDSFIRDETSQDELRHRRKKRKDNGHTVEKSVSATMPKNNTAKNSSPNPRHSGSSSSSNELPAAGAGVPTKQKKRAKKPPDARSDHQVSPEAPPGGFTRRFVDRTEEFAQRQPTRDIQNFVEQHNTVVNEPVQEPLILDPIGPPPGFEHIRPIPSPGGSSSTASSSVSFVKLDVDELRQASPQAHSANSDSAPTAADRSLFRASESDDSDAVGTFGGSTHESPSGGNNLLPEWADSTPSRTGNVDEDFSALALNTAALRFEDTANALAADMDASPSPPFSGSSSRSSSHVSGIAQFRRTPRRPNDYRKPNVANALHQPKKQKSSVEDPEIERYIGQMTRDYRERLKRAIASGMPIDEPDFEPPKLRLPDDLLANCAGGRGKPSTVWPASPPGPVSTRFPVGLLGLSPKLESASSNGTGNVGVIGDGAASRASATNLPAVTTPSKLSLPAIWSTSTSSDGMDGGSANTSIQSAHAALLSRGTEHFLFAESDPIWKPIFEEQSSSGFWSTDFNFGGQFPTNLNHLGMHSTKNDHENHNDSNTDANDNDTFNTVEKKAKNE